MATLCQFPSLSLLSSRKHFLLDPHKLQQPELGLCPQQQQQFPPQKFCRFRVSSIKKSSRRVKSNEELTDEIREFIGAVGLPEDHVPSLKEFSQHGRSDLANIVRRRGYKLIRELLESSTEADGQGSTTGKIITENTDAICELTGQDEVANDVVEFPLSTKVSTSDNHSGGLVKEPGLNMGDNINSSMKPLVDASLEEKVSLELNDHNEKADNMVEDVSLSTKVPSLETCSTASNASLAFVAGDPSGNISTNSSLFGENSNDLNGGNKMVNNSVEDTFLSMGVPVEKKNFQGLNNDKTIISDYQRQILTESSIGSSFEGNVACQSQEFNNAVEDVTSMNEILIAENHFRSSNAEPSQSADDHISVDVDSSSHLSLEEKVAKFMQNGDLDTIEDDRYDIICKSGTEEGKRYIELQDAKEVHSRINSEHSKNMLNGDDTAMVSNGNALETMQVVPSATGNSSLRDSNLTTQGPSAEFEKDQDFEPRNSENQVEINELKSMLHQKELELSRLKEEIEKEKLALSALQAKAEIKINKARKLISEKDVELQAAEDTLTGLIETRIQYYGDGDIVEMAGSFNGWQQWIKMDPLRSSSVNETSGYRKSRLWLTVLWLYPGVYEMKFIVDGHWKIDPQQETITHGTICNNILRVDK